jgi:hypothetical protein
MWKDTQRRERIVKMQYHACKLLQGTFLLNCVSREYTILQKERQKYGNVTEYFMRRPKFLNILRTVGNFQRTGLTSYIITIMLSLSQTSGEGLIVKYNITNASAQYRYWRSHWYDILCWKLSHNTCCSTADGRWKMWTLLMKSIRGKLFRNYPNERKEMYTSTRKDF